MTEDEKAAEAYAQKHNDPKIDWDVMTQEQTQALLERVSCDGCRHNFKALSLAFLAGVEHARKNPLKTRTEAEELESKLGRRVTI